MYNTLLCIVALTELFPLSGSVSYTKELGKTYTDRLAVCTAVAHQAEELNVSPSLAVSVALQESRMRDDIKGKRGELGPMQVMPRYACPKGERNCEVCDNETGVCNWVRAGILALKKWIALYPKTYLCHYNAGWVCNTRSRRYARSIMKRRARLSVQVDNLAMDFAQYENTLLP